MSCSEGDFLLLALGREAVPAGISDREGPLLPKNAENLPLRKSELGRCFRLDRRSTTAGSAGRCWEDSRGSRVVSPMIGVGRDLIWLVLFLKTGSSITSAGIFDFELTSAGLLELDPFLEELCALLSVALFESAFTF